MRHEVKVAFKEYVLISIAIAAAMFVVLKVALAG